MAKPPSLFKAATIISVVTILSKLLGLVRDQMIAYGYGASMVSDAYLFAFQIPSFALILLGGVGGPFHTAAIAILSRITPDTEKPNTQAKVLINSLITLVGIIFVVLSILSFIFAQPIIQLLANDASTELQALATIHLMWMSPMIFIGGIIGIFYGISNYYHQYVWPSLSPSAINITLIIWLLVFGADVNGYALAISTLLGAILQLAMQLPEFYKIGFRYFPQLQLQSEGLKDATHMVGPAIIGTTIGQLNVYVAMFFASQLAEGSWTAFVMGNRLIQLPIGVLTIAFLTPLFARFNQAVVSQDDTQLRNDFYLGVKSMWMMGIPMVVLTLLIAPIAIELLFERGAFDHQDTLKVSLVLFWLSLSVLPYMLRDAITRVFYAFKDTRTPLIAGGISIVLNAVLNALLIQHYDLAGIAFATVAVTLSNAMLLSLLIKKHPCQLKLPQLFSSSWRLLLAGIITLGLGLITQFTFNTYFDKTLFSLPLINLIAEMGLTILVVLISYASILVVLKEPIVQVVQERLAQKFLKKPV